MNQRMEENQPAEQVQEDDGGSCQFIGMAEVIADMEANEFEKEVMGQLKKAEEDQDREAEKKVVLESYSTIARRIAFMMDVVIQMASSMEQAVRIRDLLNNNLGIFSAVTSAIDTTERGRIFRQSKYYNQLYPKLEGAWNRFVRESVLPVIEDLLAEAARDSQV